MACPKRLSVCVAGAIFAGGLPVIASPASIREPILVTGQRESLVVRHIRYADLDLVSNPGVKRLNHRVKGAIAGLCTEAVGPDTGNLASTVANMKCSRAAWRDARPQIARAVERARQIAATGSSTIAAASIVISIPD